MYKLYTHPLHSYVTIAEIPRENIEKIDFAQCKQPTETPDAYYKRQAVKPEFITNGGHFQFDGGNAVMDFINDGDSVVIEGWTYGTGVVGDKELIFTKVGESNYRDFMSAYPPIVVRGQAYPYTYAKEMNTANRKTSIGWNNDTLFIVAVDSPGLTLTRLTNIYLELGALYAMNMDGGGSTRMLVKGERVTAQAYARPVDNVFCVYLKKEEPTPVKTPATIYRVQVGAFIFQSGAQRLLAELKSKGITAAYVVKVGAYYKVQVGAFTIRANADNMYAKIKALGYSPFITTNN